MNVFMRTQNCERGKSLYKLLYKLSTDHIYIFRVKFPQAHAKGVNHFKLLRLFLTAGTTLQK